MHNYVASKFRQEFTFRGHGPGTLALALVNHFIELYTFLLALSGFITYT